MEETLPSPAVENYLKAIYLLEARTAKPAPTGKLADRLAVAPASVTEMVQRLARDGLVKHVRYRGVRLTAEGRRVALSVVRRHRLLETFLVSELGMDWGQVHDEAETLEHSDLRQAPGQAIAAKLGDPARDPHGDPIPSADAGDRRGPGGLARPAARRHKGASRAHPRRRCSLLAYLDRPGHLAGRRDSGAFLGALRRSLYRVHCGRKRSLGRLAAAALGVEPQA